MAMERIIDWPGGSAISTRLKPFVATDQPLVYSPYAMSMVFTPVRGRYRLEEERYKDYAVPRCTLTLTAGWRLEHMASYEGGQGVIIDIHSQEYTAAIDRLVRTGKFEDGVIHRSGDAVAWSAMARLRSLLRDDPDPSFLALETLSLTLQREVVALIGGDGRSGRHGDLSQARLRRVMEYIDEHLDENVSLTALADVAVLSPYHFLRSFKRTTGMNPHQFVMARKLEIVRVAIEHGIDPSHAARSLGFLHARHFAAVYRRHHGFPPMETPRLRPMPWHYSTGSIMSVVALEPLLRRGRA